jgi:hypothetical protein
MIKGPYLSLPARWRPRGLDLKRWEGQWGGARLWVGPPYFTYLR